ncbi:hypothetical protein KSP40_PGU014994 [Platanthera guangdongensis]|uniref:Beta-amylase n=1 Tax=Platanthera guangdongensis TaxID=2320717 RepID=A0ABR2LPA6_9ASPA
MFGGKVSVAHQQKPVEAAGTADAGTVERLHRQGADWGSSGSACSGRVPVFVMLPLDTVGAGGGLSRARALGASMMALRSAGVEGVMVDVWWGVVERAGPGRYDWEAYAELVRMAEGHGLKLQMVMSFHQCGGNVGDSCNIPLPPWVTEEMSRDPDIVFTDRSGRRNPEYISLGCDMLPVLRGRTPIQVYSDYMQSFRDRFKDYLGSVIVYMMASLKAAAVAAGKEEWGRGGPHDSGQYKQFPEETGFFSRNGSWETDYGKFFLEWYSGELLGHGDRILAAAEGIFRGTGAKLSAKIAGIHWHYGTRSHAAELTAGYYNTRNHEGYLPIARMLAKRGVVMNFTCMEMRDEHQPQHANCSPELLVRQVKSAAKAAGIEIAGENALERYDEAAFSQVLGTSREDEEIGLSAFTYLRMNKKLFEEGNWRHFVAFVKGMAEGGRRVSLPRADSGSSGLYAGAVIDDKFVAAQ